MAMSQSQSRNRKKRTAGIYPPPVYVAQFADGEIGRMSFHSPVGKPIDFEYGWRVVAKAWAHPLPVVTERVREVNCGQCCWLRFEPKADCWKCQGTGRVEETYNELSAPDGSPWLEMNPGRYPPREDLIAGHVEYNGKVIPDPRFNGGGNSVNGDNDTSESHPARPDPVAKILRAVGKLSADDRARLVAALVC